MATLGSQADRGYEEMNGLCCGDAKDNQDDRWSSSHLWNMIVFLPAQYRY